MRIPTLAALCLGASLARAECRVDHAAAAVLELYTSYAAYRNGETRVVQAGENRDVTLHHDRVAVSLRRPAPLASSRDAAPADANGLAAIVSRAGQPGTGWALDLPLHACAAESDG